MTNNDPQSEIISIYSFLNNNNINNESGPSTKRITPQVRKFHNNISQEIPEWQRKLAETYLLVPDMENTTDDTIDSSNDSEKFQPQISEDTINCICRSTHDSEVMIQCDSCKRWMHMSCIRLEDSNEDETFICIYCQYQLAKAIKQYVRTKVAGLQTQLQPFLNDIQTCRIPQTQAVFAQLNDEIQQIQQTLQTIPSFLPTVQPQNSKDQ